MSNPKELIPLPHSVTKSQLVAMYRNDMPFEEIINNINEIILENRKKMPKYKGIEAKKIIRTKTVWHNEFIEFVETVGIPEGYYKQ